MSGSEILKGIPQDESFYQILQRQSKKLREKGKKKKKANKQNFEGRRTWGKSVKAYCLLA